MHDLLEEVEFSKVTKFHRILINVLFFLNSTS